MRVQHWVPGNDFEARLTSIDWAAMGMDIPQDWDEALLYTARLIGESTLPMAMLIGAEGRLVANEAALEAVGAAAFEQVTGRPITDVLPLSGEILTGAVDRVRQGENCCLTAQPIRLSASEVRLFDLHFTPVRGAGGDVVAALGIAHDVTRQTHERRDLGDAVQGLHLALQGSGMVGVWTYEAATGLASCDASVAAMFGVTHLDYTRGIDPARFSDALHPHDQPQMVAALQSSVESGAPYRGRYRVQVPTPRWIVSSGKPSYDENGQLLRLLGVVVDITDQVETVAALEESRFHFKTLTEALPQLVWSCDAEGRHDYYSTRWSEFTGIPAEAIVEDTWQQVIHPEDRALVARAWGEAMRDGRPYDLHYRVRHHSGEYRWLRVMARPARGADDAIQRWFGTSTDVHDAYRLSAEREALAAELRRIATEDQLTKVLTRRAFIECAEPMFAAAAEQREPVSLLMLDLDFFKSVNDTYGHPGGDKVLAAAAQRMMSVLKSGDLIGRLGGEEFAILAPNCTARNARQLAERVRRAVEANPIVIGDGTAVTVTVSVGVTSAEDGTRGLDHLLGTADRALYAAKANGRNRSSWLSPRSAARALPIQPRREISQER